MIKKIRKIWPIIILFVAVCTLVSCRQAGSTTETIVPDDNDAAPITLAAIQTENAILKTRIAEVSIQSATPPPPPTSTSKPIATATLSASPTYTPYPQQTITLPTGVLTASHPEAPGYIFLINPEIWTVEKLPNDPYKFLNNKEITDCRIDITPPETDDPILRLSLEEEGRLQWITRQYETYVSYQRPDLSIDLSNFDIEDCNAAQKEVLRSVLTIDEYMGAPTITPIPAPTDRPPLAGFTCPDTLPTRIRVGDQAVIVAEFLWLRKEPDPENPGAEIRLYPQNGPITIRVVGGPKCISPFIYWEVEVTELGEEGEFFDGWMAESDGEDYFLDVWNTSW